MSLKLQELLSLAMLLTADLGYGLDSTPVKLGVEVDQHSIRPDEKLVVRVGLFNAANQSAKAAKLFAVSLQVRLASGTVEHLQTVAIAAGESNKRAAVSLPGSGLVYVWARHPELLPGGEYVEVRASEPAPHPGTNSPAVAPNTRARPSLAKRQPPTVAGLPQITFRYSPDRAFLADGKDTVNVEAFLIGADEALPADLYLNVYDSSNALRPTPLTIPAGKSNGRSVLTSSQVGAVTVEFLGSTPPAEFQGDKKLSIKFMPPITRLDLQVSPPHISLVDTADLIVTLTDDRGRPLATDTPRPVAFSITSGRGQIAQRELQIPAGQFEVRTTFAPEWSGQVSVSGSTPNLVTVARPMQVSIPLTLLLCSGLGGLVGGLLSRRTRRKSYRWRVPIGLATGFLFYWACIFLGLTATKREVVLNPLSALALSAIGGWLQTQVFTMVWDVLRPGAKA